MFYRFVDDVVLVCRELMASLVAIEQWSEAANVDGLHDATFVLVGADG